MAQLCEGQGAQPSSLRNQPDLAAGLDTAEHA